MTPYGDFMPGATYGRSGFGWIVPVCRITKVLGMKLVWGSDKVTLGYQDGKDIVQTLHFGLPFMDWD
eukprot:6708162-Prorocentrum_lima.AAC.1